jgi:hypothetical protein
MSNLQAASHESAPTAFARFKSTLARLVGAKPVEEPKQADNTPSPDNWPKASVAVWSKEWCAQDPEMAAMAIATLQEQNSVLKTYIKTKDGKPRKHRVSTNPKGIYLSSVPPNTYFKVLRNGEIYRTSSTGWRHVFNHESGKTFSISGITRVLILHSRPD